MAFSIPQRATDLAGSGTGTSAEREECPTNPGKARKSFCHKRFNRILRGGRSFLVRLNSRMPFGTLPSGGPCV